MYASKLWSEKRKAFIRSLIPNKKILFIDVELGKAKLDEHCNYKDYDLMIGYYKALSIYIICKPEYHIGRKSVDFSRILDTFKGRNNISVEYKRAPTTPVTMEPVLIVTENKIEKIGSNLSHYMDILEKRN